MENGSKAFLRAAVGAMVSVINYPAVLRLQAKTWVSEARALFMTPRQRFELQIQTIINNSLEELEVAQRFEVDKSHPALVEQLEYEVGKTRELLGDVSTPPMGMHNQCVALISAQAKLNRVVMRAVDNQYNQLLEDIVS